MSNHRRRRSGAKPRWVEVITDIPVTIDRRIQSQNAVLATAYAGSNLSEPAQFIGAAHLTEYVIWERFVEVDLTGLIPNNAIVDTIQYVQQLYTVGSPSSWWVGGSRFTGAIDRPLASLWKTPTQIAANFLPPAFLNISTALVGQTELVSTDIKALMSLTGPTRFILFTSQIADGEPVVNNQFISWNADVAAFRVKYGYWG